MRNILFMSIKNGISIGAIVGDQVSNRKEKRGSSEPFTTFKPLSSTFMFEMKINYLVGSGS